MAGSRPVLLYAPDGGGSTDDSEAADAKGIADDGEATDAGGSNDAEETSSAGRTPADALAIEAPETSALDEEIRVRVSGADPGEAVTVTASFEDGGDVEWSASATFAADDDGVVDLSTDAPVRGDWEGVAPMAWCWAMTSDGDARGATLASTPAIEVTVAAATAGGGREATRSITRQVADPDVAAHDVDVAATGLTGTWYEPPGEGPHPGVVSLHGGGGRTSDRTARLLASRGFATLALAYVGEADPLPDRLERVSLLDVERGLSWFRDRSAVADRPVGLFGVSRGAELALLLGARSDQVGAVVSYAGSGCVYDTPAGTPAWVDADGEAIPHLTAVGEPERGPDGTPISRPILERGFEEAGDERRRAATIPVEEIDGPVLLVSGGDDRVWPARKLSAVAERRLVEAGFDHPFDHLTDDDVGHLIGVPYVPLGNFDRGGGSAAATVRLGAEAWDRTLEYFERGLTGE